MSEDRTPEGSEPGKREGEPWRGQLRYTPLFDIADGPAPPKLVGPFGSPDGLTIPFGDGGSGKSIIVETLALSVAANTDLVPGMVPTISGPVGWLDFEGKRRQTRHRAGRLITGTAPVIYVPCAGAMWEEAERVSRIVEAEGLVLLIVDSVGYAMGSKYSASNDEAARFFTMAIHDIELPTFGIAHVPKGSSDQTKPYGSAFWHNGASQTWAVEKVAKPGHVVRLTNRKDNDGELAPALVLEIEWGDRIIVRRGKATPLDTDLVLAVKEVGPASTEAILEWLAAGGWLISWGSLTDRLAVLAGCGRILRTGKTKGTRWASLPSGSNLTPNGAEAGTGPTPNDPLNTSQGGARRAAEGAE